jgi:hypothetical protein
MTVNSSYNPLEDRVRGILLSQIAGNARKAALEQAVRAEYGNTATEPTAPQKASQRNVRSPKKTAVEAFPLTTSQKSVAEALIERAELHFSVTDDHQTGIPIQTNSLIFGPTGSGKTSVVEAVARKLQADLFKVSHGNWIVEGAVDNAGTPTVRQLLTAVARAERLVLFIDELDKFFRPTEASAWHSALLNDLWLVLDRGLSWSTLAGKPELRCLNAEERTPENLENIFRKRVFIVAAGTWQDTYRTKSRVGFITSQVEASRAGSLADILKAGGLPEEVMRRFNADALRLDYPKREELASLLAKDAGLNEACRKAGRTPDISELYEQMATMGMTALTSFKTQVLLDARRTGRTH